MRDNDRRPGRLRFEQEEQSAGTSGQVGPKSGNLRQDSKRPRPSERLRHENKPPPDDETDTDGGAAPIMAPPIKRRQKTVSAWRSLSSAWKRAAKGWIPPVRNWRRKSR